MNNQNMGLTSKATYFSFRKFSLLFLIFVLICMIAGVGIKHWIVYYTSWGYLVELFAFFIIVLLEMTQQAKLFLFLNSISPKIFSFALVVALTVTLYFFLIVLPLAWIQNMIKWNLLFFGIITEHIFPFLLLYIEHLKHNDFDYFSSMILFANVIFMLLYYTFNGILYYALQINCYEFLPYEHWIVFPILGYGVFLGFVSYYLIIHTQNKKQQIIQKLLLMISKIISIKNNVLNPKRTSSIDKDFQTQLILIQ